jgi:hypothetical protein
MDHWGFYDTEYTPHDGPAVQDAFPVALWLAWSVVFSIQSTFQFKSNGACALSAVV